MSLGSSVDCLIAQIAIEHGLYLLHNDSDYDRIAQISPLKIYGGSRPQTELALGRTSLGSQVDLIQLGQAIKASADIHMPNGVYIFV